MTTTSWATTRPPIHLLASESDLVANVTLMLEDQQPVVAAMILQEIERAELHGPKDMPDDHVMLDSHVTFIDERSQQVRKVQLVLPANANIIEGRISILTPIGAAIYGLAAGASISWPDLDGNERTVRILGVEQPSPRRTPSVANFGVSDSGSPM